ncbi:MAG: hypothetical protein F7C34_05670 [Desulfurococcales archaeon]|nr:hypothetical protein [Desulfurococcales archaeon]
MANRHPCIVRGVLRGAVTSMLLALLYLVLSSARTMSEPRGLLAVLASSTAYMAGVGSAAGPLVSSVSLVALASLWWPGKEGIVLALGVAVVGFVALARGGLRREPLYDSFRHGLTLSRLTAAIALASLYSWLAGLDPERSLYLIISGAVQGLYVPGWLIPRVYATLLGALAGLPGLGVALAGFFSSYPLPSSCPKGHSLGGIVASRQPASHSRMISEPLGMACTSGYWMTPLEGARILVVEGPLPRVPGSIHVVFERREISLSDVDAQLSSASSVARAGGIGVVRVGIMADTSTLEAVASVIGSYAASSGIPLLIDACMTGTRLAESLVRAAEAGSFIAVRICQKPPQSLTRFFTGSGSARVLCSSRDPELVSWAASSILGITGSEEALNDLKQFLARGFCVTSNACGRASLYRPVT